jgi:hypothetical protein
VPLSGNPKLTFRLTFCDVGRLTGTLYAICGLVLRPMAVIAHTGVRAFGQSPDENEAGELAFRADVEFADGRAGSESFCFDDPGRGGPKGGSHLTLPAARGWCAQTTPPHS